MYDVIIEQDNEIQFLGVMIDDIVHIQIGH